MLECARRWVYGAVTNLGKPMPQLDDLLDFAAAADTLGVSHATLYRWIRARRVAAFKVGRQWRFRREDLKDALEERSERSDSLLAGLTELVRVVGEEVPSVLAGLPLPERPDAAGSAAARLLLEAAARRGATDVHINPVEGGGLALSLRCGGRLVLAGEADGPAADAVRRGLADLAGGIDELVRRGLGRVGLVVDDRTLTLRVAWLPTVKGPQVVVRIIDPSAYTYDLARVFPDEAVRASVERILDLSHGLVLVGGPTGSGKTTSAFAMLHHLAERGLAVTTIEEPVHVLLDGVVQVDVTPELPRLAALRRVMLGDPDVVFLEADDPDAARAACRAALRGPIVIVQVHAGSAAETVAGFTRLVGAPRLVASCLAAASSQRLVRKLCPECAQTVAAPPVVAELGADAPRRVRVATGCGACSRGYRGRTAIYEFLHVDDALLEAVADGADVDRIAARSDVRPLARGALDLVAAGVTSVEEAQRVVRWG